MATTGVHIPSLKAPVARGLVDPETETWLENAVNPFPDYETHPVGVPSDTSSHTAVKHIQKQISIVAPEGTVGTWTAFVLLMPFDTSGTQAGEVYGARLSDSRAEINAPQLLPNNDMGILTVFTHDDALAGSANPFSNNFVPGNCFTQSIKVTDAWITQGAFRLSSCGWELTDNTPALYAGGNLVCFRKDSMADHKTFLIQEGTSSTDNWYPNDNTTLYTGIPHDLPSAYRVPGATSWNFKDGCYVTGTFNHHMEDFETLDPYGGCVLASGAGDTPCLYLGGLPVESGDYRRTGKGWCKTHLNHSGAYGTGLAKEVNFTLTLKCDMEIIPTADSVLVDFIKPGVPASPGIRNLYSKMASAIPAAVPRADNDAGSFFKKMVGLAGPLVSKIFPMAAPLVAPLSGLANQGIDALSARRQAKKAGKAAARPAFQLTNSRPGTSMMSLTSEEQARILQRRSRANAGT